VVPEVWSVRVLTAPGRYLDLPALRKGPDMTRLLWMLAGLVGGVALSRNAEPMSNPQKAGVLFALVVGCGFCWWAAYRGKAGAVATAVAVAVAKAEATAVALSESRAQAVAQNAVVIALGGNADGLDARELWQAHHVVDQVRNDVALGTAEGKDLLSSVSALTAGEKARDSIGYL
jgi:hypothetical protein